MKTVVLYMHSCASLQPRSLLAPFLVATETVSAFDADDNPRAGPATPEELTDQRITGGDTE